VTDRRKTDCLKYDFAVQRGKPEHILPMWVADMDFPTSSRILDAVKERVEHGIFGYTETGDDYFEAVSGWMRERHGWQVEKSWLLKTPGVVYALAMAVRACTGEGDAVLIQPPVYYPFREVIADNGRVVVTNDLVQDENGRYRIDFADFEEKIVANKVKLFLLCSPHNPVGRVWTRDELLRIGDICKRHHVVVASDEIHEDFAFGGNKHTVFASLSKEFSDMTITCTSPGKTFNLAGLQISNIFIANEVLRAKFRKQIDATGYSQLNTLGLVACEAAYRYGGTWYDELMRYLEGNFAFLDDYLRQNLPQIRFQKPEGTYLAWLDFRELSLDSDALEQLVIKRANLWLDRGAMFGVPGEGFERMNVACPRETLAKALDQLYAAMDDSTQVAYNRL
jgi:cystathionine beta-lyase